MNKSIQPFIEQLKQARKKKKLTQRALAKKVGVPQSHISKIESGKVNLTLANFIELAKRLDYEMMLIPRQDIILIQSIIASKEVDRDKQEVLPAYVPDQDEDA